MDGHCAISIASWLPSFYLDASKSSFTTAISFARSARAMGNQDEQ